MALSKKSIADAQDLISMKKTEDPSDERAMKLKSDWNQYVTWLSKKGVAGKAELNEGEGENNLGIKYVRQYQKENPATLISPETIKEVQSHFQNYREYAINKIKTKKADYTGDINTIDKNFMQALSIVDGIPGEKTTAWMFPNEFMKTVYKTKDGAVEKTEVINQGITKK